MRRSRKNSEEERGKKEGSHSGLPRCARNDERQSGNVFIIILVGIALFAALSMVVSRSMQSSSSTKMSERELDLIASEILDYGQTLARAVDRVRRKGCSENDISFANDIVSGYEHTPVVEDKCRVFHPDGGGASWRSPPSRVSDGSEWSFYANRVGSFNGVENFGTSNPDLVVLLKNFDRGVCEFINNKVNQSLSDIWESGGAHNGGGVIDTIFVGDYNPVGLGNGINGAPTSVSAPETGCFCDGNPTCTGTSTFYFYHMLLVR